jgi:hypothetical protein
MAKRDNLVADAPVLKADILNKIDELDAMVEQYFSQFHKATAGQRSISEATVPFVQTCVAKMNEYPEILSGTFNKEDFTAKAQGVTEFFELEDKLEQMNAKWEMAAKICKTDAMYYANEFYSIIQKEAARNTRYKPTCDVLTAFYKRSKSTEPKNKLPDTMASAN